MMSNGSYSYQFLRHASNKPPIIRKLIILLLIVGCVFAREYIAIIDFEGSVTLYK